jgi:hypothetical protein
VKADVAETLIRANVSNPHSAEPILFSLIN